MKTIETIRRRVERLITAPGEELGRWARFARFQIQLWRFCGRRLRDHNALAMSAALSFRTIFAMVPTLVLALLVVKSVGMLGERRTLVQNALRALNLDEITLVRRGEADDGEGARQAPTRPRRRGGDDTAGGPTTRPGQRDLGDVITRLVEQVEAKLTFGRVGPVGVLLLIWSVLAMLTTIERSLNRIFGAVRSRSLGRRVLLYWSVVTLGPVVLMAAVYLGGRLTEASQNVPGLPWLLAGLGWLQPVIVGVLLLAALYKLMPNTTVAFRAAVGGAIVAVGLWVVAMWGFAVYVRQLAGTSLYGTLGLLPLFLIWLNLSWLIFLFGAELAHTAVNLERMQKTELAERAMLGPSELLAVALAVARPYLRGQGPVPFERIAASVPLPEESLARLLERLSQAEVTCPVERGRTTGYVLARPADQVRLTEVLAAGGSLSPEGCERAIGEVLSEVRQRTQAAVKEATLADAAAWTAGGRPSAFL